MEIIKAGTMAPSASNRQHWQFIVVDKESMKERMVKQAGAQKQIMDAPCLIVVLYDATFNEEHYANIQSVSAAVQNILLRTCELGLGACWLAGFGKEEEVSKLLGVPNHLKPLCIIMLGESAENPPLPPKKDIRDIVHFNEFQNGKGAPSLPIKLRSSEYTLSEIREHQKFLSRSSYFGKDYEIYSEEEVNKITSLVQSYLPKKRGHILSVFSYDGTLLRPLSSALTGHHLIDLELSREAAIFVNAKTTKMDFFVSDAYLPLKSSSIDMILFLFSLEKVPILKNQTIFSEAKRALKPEGKLIIFCKNKLSFYGLFYQGIEKLLKINRIEDAFLSSGPFEPVSTLKIKKLLKKISFSIQLRSLFFFPMELTVYKERLNGYLKRHGRNLSILKHISRPALSLLSLLAKATKKINLPLISSSTCIIAEKISSGD